MLLIVYMENDNKSQDSSWPSASPFFLGYRPGHGVDAAWVVGLTGQVPAQHCPHQVQRQDDKYADTCHRNLGIYNHAVGMLSVLSPYKIETMIMWQI